MKKPDYKQKLKHLFEGLNGVVLSDANLSMNKQIPEIFNIDSVQEFANKLQSTLIIPSPPRNSQMTVKAGVSTLGGRENPTVMLLIAFDPKDKWAHGILENSHYARFHISKDGVIEMFSGHQIKNKWRKTRVKSVDDALAKLYAWTSNEANGLEEGIEDLNTTVVNPEKKDGIFDDPYAQQANISVNPDGAGNPNPALPETEIPGRKPFVKKEVRYLKVGDVLNASGAKIIQAPVAGLKTPTGKVEIGVEYPGGKKKIQLWGKYTVVGVLVPPAIENGGAGDVNDKLPDEIQNNETPAMGLGSGLGEEQETGNSDYNEGTPTNPDVPMIKPRIGEEQDGLQFKPKAGFWDVTKYPYGGHFDRFTGAEKGKLIPGTVKMGDEIRVQLEDGRTVICNYSSVVNKNSEEVLDQANKIGRKIV